MHHSDRGCQYTSYEFKILMDRHQVVTSMSGVGHCYDNAVMESFFHTLKTEHTDFCRFRTTEEAKQSIFEYIEVFYNRERLHPTLGYLSPLLKQKIQNARLSAAITVNQKLIKLYWEIGKIIFEIQQAQKWGYRDIESLGNELQKEFPGVSGFSRSNLFKMRAFYLSYEKVSQTVKQFEELPVSQIPWGHNVILVTKIKDTKERLWYAHMTIEEGWSREALEDAIASKFFHRHGKAITNFKDRLPEPQSQLAQEVLKDPYQFDFLELRHGYKERELEQGLIDHIQQFLIELRQGFAFVARQYHIEVDGDDYYIDLLFYHLQLRCYCVVEIKTTSFKPEYAGKQKQIKQHSFWEELPSIAEPSDKIPSEQWNKLFEQVNQFQIETNRVLKEPQRNETCNCGSGKKYKKCCMNKPLLPDLLSNIKIEESIISYGSLEYSDSMKALPAAERESILNLYPLITENPEEVLQIAPKYIEKYPDIPMLYNFLYGAYRELKRPREAMKLMKETLQIFPDYLFGRVEYALYLLRRGEPEKAHAALENAGNLSQLYPERTVFHAAEWKAFAYVMSRYWIQKNDINQAKIYLQIIQKVSPKSHEVRDLQEKMKSKVFAQLMEKQQATPSHQMSNGRSELF